MTTEERVIKIVADKLNCKVEEINKEQILIDDLDADSIDRVFIAMNLEKEFEIVIGDHEIENFKIVNDLIQIVNFKLTQHETPEPNKNT